MKTRTGICNRKRRFATRDDAEAVAARASFRLRAYRCELCREYHLTSRTKGMKTPRHELHHLHPDLEFAGRDPAGRIEAAKDERIP